MFQLAFAVISLYPNLISIHNGHKGLSRIDELTNIDIPCANHTIVGSNDIAIREVEFSKFNGELRLLQRRYGSGVHMRLLGHHVGLHSLRIAHLLIACLCRQIGCMLGIVLLRSNRFLRQQSLISRILTCQIIHIDTRLLDRGTRHAHLRVGGQNLRTHRLAVLLYARQIRNGLRQPQTIFSSLQYDQRIAPMHRLIRIKANLLNESLYARILRGNITAYTCIIRIFHAAKMTKLKHYKSGAKQENKDYDNIINSGLFHSE